MGNVVGIDLGTTNSVAAFKLAEVEVVTAADNTPPGRKLTRSVVAVNGDRLIVGDEAYRQLKAAAENVIVSVKRLMGRSFNDPVVQQQLSKLSYKVSQSSEGTENSLSIWLNNKEYEPEDISAEILKKVIDNAQTYQSERGQKSRITEAVITIPAYFNDKQRYATQMAARRAGITARELLSEPTAAAISYGFKPDSDDVKTILVYDFGGGTFDSSLITAAGNQFIESGKAGDLWLGGDDIDSSLIELVKKKVAQEEDLDDIDGLIAKMPRYQGVRFLGDLKMAVERAKIDLSTQMDAKIIPGTPLLDDLGMAISIDVTITRKEFESMIGAIVDRTINICQDAIKYSDYPPEMIDIILLVGGSSQIPLVQEKVKAVFGAERVVVHPRPMYAVAEGAAIVAAGLTEKVSTVSRDYFIELVDNPEYPIIKQGDILPVKTIHTFRTEAHNQRLIHFKFSSPDKVREEREKIKNNERIGEMWLALEDSHSKGTEVLVTVELDEQNNSLEITAALKNNPSVKVSSSFSRGNSDEKISSEVEQIIHDLNEEKLLTSYGAEKVSILVGDIVKAANQIRGRDGKEQSDRKEIASAKLQELKMFASSEATETKSYIREFEFVVENCSNLLPDSQLSRIKSLLGSLKEALGTNNLSAMHKLLEDAKQEYDNLPDMVTLLLACKYGISNAYNIERGKGEELYRKFDRVLGAIADGNGDEADRLLTQLLPDVTEYLDKEIPMGSIATGITR
ncbi:MAG: Chaperone protein DnaK [Chroococcopsis gigantea SAG 12.99]|jgi:molecular chaperone DnaK|nr:Hsp70 family protein [Chlorogloea purpurea SAG 13.99]MDV3001927.1 Chaperone protein DnaK [Chroococcopsis gigantea SAG 12.99]